jgi:ABC-type transport system involved in cytochrome bd biosynthesis fused ATPase/permease subunit
MRSAANAKPRGHDGHGWLEWYGGQKVAPVVRSYLGQKRAVRGALLTAGVQTGGSLIDAMLLRMVGLSGPTPMALPWLALWAGHAGFQRVVVQPRFRDQVGAIGDRGAQQLWNDTAKAAHRRRPPKNGPSTDALFDDVEQVSSGWQLYMPWLALDTLTVAGAVAGSVILGGPLLGAAMGVTAAVIAVQGRRSMRQVTAVDERQHRATVDLRHKFRDLASAHGWDLFRRMGAGKLGRGRVGGAAKEEASAAYAARKPRLRAGVWTAAAEVLFTAGTIAWAVATGNPLMALGPMILAAQAFSAAVRIPQNLMGVKPAIAASERLSRFLRSPAQVVDRANARELPRRLQRGVEIDHVTFGYGDGRPVLRDLSLHLRPGEVLALSGHNAAGKSTLIDVIQRKFDVRQGSIRIDGIDLRDAKLDSLDGLIGRSVPQEDHVMSGTLRENLTFGLPGVDERQLLDACRRTGLDRWLASDAAANGLDTYVSNDTLSGGTRQRIALARLLLDPPALALLDEPTSALDRESRMPVLKEVLDALRAAGSAVLLVSHDTAANAMADRVAVLEHGHVVREGRVGRGVEARRDLDAPEYDPAIEREMNDLQNDAGLMRELGISR